MPLADYELGDNIYQTSNTGGVGAQTLLAPPTGRLGFEDHYADGAKVLATIKGDTDIETSWCTFNTGPNRITRDTLVRSTTGGFVNFPGGGVLDITCGLPGRLVERLFDPTAPNGVLCRKGVDGDWIARTLGDGSWVKWTNPTGAGGPPALNDADVGGNFVRKTGSIGEIITGLKAFASNLRLQGERIIADVLLSGSTKELILRASLSDDSDMALRIAQQAADSYLADIRVAGAWKRLHYDGDAAINAATVLGFDWDSNFDYTGDGYRILAGSSSSERLIIQFGTTGTITTQSTTGGGVTFPIAFPNALLGAVATGKGTPTNFSQGGTITASATTGITIHNGHNVSMPFFWVAVGN